MVTELQSKTRFLAEYVNLVLVHNWGVKAVIQSSWIIKATWWLAVLWRSLLMHSYNRYGRLWCWWSDAAVRAYRQCVQMCVFSGRVSCWQWRDVTLAEQRSESLHRCVQLFEEPTMCEGCRGFSDVYIFVGLPDIQRRLQQRYEDSLRGDVI